MPAFGILGLLEEALQPSGIRLRGVFSFGAGAGPMLSNGGTAGSVVLLGNIGGSIWPAFSAWRKTYAGNDPLDTWSKAVIGPIAQRMGATAFFPSDQPYMPFQQWAKQAEGLTASPLGILIHPIYGTWHGYRAALAFADPVGPDSVRPEPRSEPSAPCESCVGKPCLSACPVGAITLSGFDVGACRTHLFTEEGRSGCMAAGCLARNSCPVGASYRYRDEQLRFHMDALFR